MVSWLFAAHFLAHKCVRSGKRNSSKQVELVKDTGRNGHFLSTCVRLSLKQLQVLKVSALLADAVKNDLSIGIS